MEDSPQQDFDNPQPEINEQPTPSYWSSIAIAGLIFGILAFALSLISTYSVINSEPTGSYFSPLQIGIWLVTCLVAAGAGMLAIWHYEREYEVSITLGKGALIGFLTGVAMAIIGALLNQFWQQFIDPDMMQKFVDSMIANMEAMEMPEEQKQQAIDMTAQSAREGGGFFSQLLTGIPLYGVLNLITGMIGVKIFGQKEKEF